MWFNKKIQNKVYRLYLKGIPILYISLYLKMSFEDIEEIIDYMNEIFN